MDITLTLDADTAAFVHTVCAKEYLSYMTVADYVALIPTDDGNPPVIGQLMRNAAECARQVGQMIELQSIDIEPADWRWPQRT